MDTSYKIKKYTHKLKHASSGQHANTYYNRLKYYKSYRTQYGGADDNGDNNGDNSRSIDQMKEVVKRLEQQCEENKALLGSFGNLRKPGNEKNIDMLQKLIEGDISNCKEISQSLQSIISAVESSVNGQNTDQNELRNLIKQGDMLLEKSNTNLDIKADTLNKIMEQLDTNLPVTKNNESVHGSPVHTRVRAIHIKEDHSCESPIQSAGNSNANGEQKSEEVATDQPDADKPMSQEGAIGQKQPSSEKDVLSKIGEGFAGAVSNAVDMLGTTTDEKGESSVPIVSPVPLISSEQVKPTTSPGQVEPIAQQPGVVNINIYQTPQNK